MAMRIITFALDFEQDIVTARQRARQIAAILGFDSQDQARIATAASEIARNAYRYAGRGEVEFMLEGDKAPQLLIVRIADSGPGISDLPRILSGQYRSTTGMGMGIIGARRLMDQCEIRSERGAGTEVLLKKLLSARAPLFKQRDADRLAQTLMDRVPTSPVEEIQQQNRELLRAMEELRERQEELVRVNHELEDTNRGVVALYAELDEKADHLRRADQMKSRFLSNMSHEFRTPLNSIRALSRLLLDRVDGPVNAEQEKQLNFIRKAAEDLSQLVDDLLDLAKIEAGKIDVRPVEFNAVNLFSALRGVLRPLLASDAVHLRFEEPRDVPMLYTDEAKVSQILRNFISNALKFTERGEVTVSASADADAGTVTFTVADTGIGIAKEDQQAIFEEFTQVQGPLQNRVKGTGLGLPLCSRLAGLLDGTIGLTSERGVGSTFWVTLPVQHVQTQAGPSIQDAVMDPAKAAVLVVEDEAETQLLYEKMLRDTPYQIVAARTLREARLALQAMHPVAIILDILLRGEDTWRWLSELKSNEKTRHIPVLVATTVEDERKGYALGADAYMPKPIDRDRLLAQLKRFTSARMLVIDDDPASRYAIRKLLDAALFNVVEAEDAASGLQAAHALLPQVIVLDLGLPDQGGEAVLEELQRSPDTQGIPVVIATSRELAEHERQALQRSARAIVSKRDLHLELMPAVIVALGKRLSGTVQ